MMRAIVLFEHGGPEVLRVDNLQSLGVQLPPEFRPRLPARF